MLSMLLFNKAERIFIVIDAMLSVAFCEFPPQAILMHHSKPLAFSAVIGIPVGLLIIYV